MKKVGWAGLALLALAVPHTVAAATAPAPAVTADQHTLAGQVVRLLNSEALTRAQIAKMLNETLPKTLSADPDFAVAEKEHPGFTSELVGAMGSVILDSTIIRLPSLWTRLEPLYEQSFTAAELRTLVDFYTSPAGTRLIKAMGEGADYSQMLGKAVATGDSKVTSDDLHSAVQAGTAAVIRTASDEDIAAMIALGATSAGKKLIAVNREVQAAAAAWSNEEDPAIDAKVEQAISAVISKYSGKPSQ